MALVFDLKFEHYRPPNVMGVQEATPRLSWRIQDDELGAYEAEVNGSRVGDYFLAPGWTSYHGRIQYQTYDVAPLLIRGDNCIGVRVAEGWFSGRLGFEGGHRNIWGPHTVLFAQPELVYNDGQQCVVATDGSWKVTRGPIRRAEIYDGEQYDATLEVPGWSTSRSDQENQVAACDSVLKLAALPESTHLVTGLGEPVRRLETIAPVTAITTPKGKTVLDFGQNLVGYAQIDGWPGDLNLASFEAIVCHTDMAPVGAFSCSDLLLNQLYKNVVWGMMGNFLSVPTDCPQRDERLRWSGDLALFAPTACLIYDCFGMLKNWLVDLEYDQHVLDGVPPMASPNATLPDPIWFIWHDVTILAPWELYQETGDTAILSRQYNSMVTWMKALPRNKSAASRLWDPTPFQLGDWLDPSAPQDQPWKGATDAKMVSNMFLIQSLDLMAQISGILGNDAEQK
ncbi:hypothetical protein BFJ63_vAg17323 [Fusarium oxysporum f. sp. narcissi]|uniref:alpha-L-rhamnosidase n=1 Tax=Fusarium oxysporum f. sp. narcissi TaxID=451672 RepID=A0A4Q2V024_FUSOX|nr:hypothetical protein BFJ63_vAg17323 [Fusarium oxysporum f. sp. narcissi]